MDAIHAIRDESRPDIVSEIAVALRDGPGRERHVHLVLENDANQSHYLERGDDDKPLFATAQWNDDLHHALHVLTTAETDGYYADYVDAPLDHLGRALAEGFAYQGRHSPFRNAQRGEPSAQLPAPAFVGFFQNHDQVGNRAFGERIHTLADARLIDAAYVCLLLTPQVPMLFMGEEFAASTPFLFFCDFGAEFAAAIAQGRRDEFKRFAAFADEALRARIPDPNATTTFQTSKLNWEECERSPHRERLATVRALLDLRQRHLLPRLGDLQPGGQYRIEGESELLRVAWRFKDHSCWRLTANFARHDLYSTADSIGETIHAHGIHDAAPAGTRFEPGATRVSVGPCA